MLTAFEELCAVGHFDVQNFGLNALAQDMAWYTLEVRSVPPRLSPPPHTRHAYTLLTPLQVLRLTTMVLRADSLGSQGFT